MSVLPAKLNVSPSCLTFVVSVELDEDVITKRLFVHFCEGVWAALHDEDHVLDHVEDVVVFFIRHGGFWREGGGRCFGLAYGRLTLDCRDHCGCCRSRERNAEGCFHVAVSE